MSVPRRYLPSIPALRALEALDRLESASAAAQELSLTQGAVSRQIQALEQQLGTTLVIRSGKRLRLTDPARSYAAEVRHALNRIAQASLRVQTPPRGGTLNLAILPAFGMRWLMPRLPAFARKHPNIVLNMGTELVPFSFATESYSAALHYGAPDWPGADHLLLRHERLIPVCAPSLCAKAQSAREVLRYPLIHIETRPNAWADWLATQSVQVKHALPGTLYDQFSTILEAAAHGLGVALVPDYLVEQDLAKGQLVAPFGSAGDARDAYYLVWPKDLSTDPTLIAFRDWLAEQAEPEDPLPR